MPTVYLPLGSQSASGTMGEMFVYQGTMVRAWVVPKDPRTDAQVDIRKLFFDITKMTRSMGAWPVAACKTVFGPRWFTTIYKMVRAVMFNIVPAWGQTGDDIWNSWTELQQTAWNEAAPFQATWNEPGRIFWNTYFGIHQSMQDWFEMPLFEGVYIVPPVAWWNKTLAGVPSAGVYDDGADLVTFYGNWSTVNDALAYGGTYKATVGSALRGFTFYFYGKKAELTWMVGPACGDYRITVDYVGGVVVSLYRASTLWQQVWSSGVLRKGLHQITCAVNTAADCNLDAVTTSSPKVAAGVPKVEGATYALGVLEMAEQTAQPVTPTSDNSKMYFSSDGLLHVLDSTGAPKTVVPDSMTQAQADLRYLQSVPQQDHGGLSGLADDDHAQYYNQTRGDARYMQLGTAPVAWPVGSIFIGAVVTNPATLLGYGTWAAFGAGRVLVGIDATQTEFDLNGETGGAKTHALSVAELAVHGHIQNQHTHTEDAHNHLQNAHNHIQDAHNHTQDAHSHTTPGDNTSVVGAAGRFMTSNGTGTNVNISTTGVAAVNVAATPANQVATAINQQTTPAIWGNTATNQNTGSGTAHNNLQPYIVVYMWKRTA